MHPTQKVPQRIPTPIVDRGHEIYELDEKGVIMKGNEPTEWISSLVVVLKPENIRIF